MEYPCSSEKNEARTLLILKICLQQHPSSVRLVIKGQVLHTGVSLLSRDKVHLRPAKDPGSLAHILKQTQYTIILLKMIISSSHNPLSIPYQYYEQNWGRGV